MDFFALMGPAVKNWPPPPGIDKKRSQGWLPDEIINSCGLLLNNSYYPWRLERELPAMGFVTTYYANKMISGDDASRWFFPSRALGRTRSKSPTAGSLHDPLRLPVHDLWDLEVILVPVNLAGSHWVLVEVDLRKGAYRWYDSGLCQREVANRVCAAISSCLGRLMLQHPPTPSFKLPPFSTSDVYCADMPQQKDGTSCGVFALFAALWLFEGGNFPGRTPISRSRPFIKDAPVLRRGLASWLLPHMESALNLGA